MTSAAPNAADQPHYRPDIDGLRAIAVLSVILFHVDKTLLPGGFAGVDIFFVISGYLISRNILLDLTRGDFSLADFYRRRVKRIALPMLLVVAVTVGVTQLLFLPEDAERTAESALWSVLSLANVYFWRHQDTSYFAAASSDTPLLHLWSLGVEEQFYLLWPLLLMATFRRSGAARFLGTAALVALASFLLGELLFGSAPGFVYYMLPTRAGELLLGAIVAVAVVRHYGRTLPGRAIPPMAVAGLLLMALPLFLLSEDQVFPGLRAIPPTAGTALLIFAGHRGVNPISRFLAVKPLVWIGAISYSAYLWHWPLLAFYRYGHEEVGPLAGSVIVLATLLLARITYLLVERPARHSTKSLLGVFTRQYLVPGGAVAIMALAALKTDGYGFRGRSGKYQAALEAVREKTRPAYAYPYVCQRQRIAAADVADTSCVLGSPPGTPPQALLWGDSFAAQYVGMIGVFAQKEGFRFRNLAIGACPPILGDPGRFASASRRPDCRAAEEFIRPLINTFRVIIISASWTGYQARSGDFLEEFLNTARTLASEGRLVILIGKAPFMAGYDRRCREKALSYPGLDCPPYSLPLTPDLSGVNARLRDFARNTPNVGYFDVTPYLCELGRCPAYDAEGNPIYYDRYHLSMSASWKLGERIWSRAGVPAPFNSIAGWLRSGDPVLKPGAPPGF